MFQRSITKIVILGLVLTICWSGIVEAGKGGGSKDDSVMSQHIKEADGISGQDTNTGSGIKTGHIQDEAITAAKISFYTNVIVVAPSGGDFTDPITALSAITDASATNPYLVKIMPGVDASTQQRFYEMLDMLNKEHDITIVMVTHDVGVVTKHVNKIACLNQRLVFHGTHDEFCSSHVVQEIVRGEHHLVCHRH